MIWYVFLFVALYCSVVTFDIYNQEQHIYVKWLHVDKIYVQVHVYNILNITSRRKRNQTIVLFFRNMSW